jgi:hypothetical protein
MAFLYAQRGGSVNHGGVNSYGPPNRLVGAWANLDGGAVPAAPSLEDGYVRLMQV